MSHVGRAEVLEYNQCFGDAKELAEQFRDVAKLSRKVEKPVFHLTLRAAPGDQLTKAVWIDIGRAAAKEFGFSDHQFLTILHKDTKEPHIHIVANRVGYKGKAAGDNQSYARMAALCRRIEKDHNLKPVLSPRRYLSMKDRQIPRQDTRKTALRQKIEAAIRQSPDYSAFEKRMKEAGYTVIKGRGIAFEDAQKVRIKGSEVGFSVQTISQLLDGNRQALSNRPLATWSRPNQRKALKDHLGSGPKQLLNLIDPAKVIAGLMASEYLPENMAPPAARIVLGSTKTQTQEPH